MRTTQQRNATLPNEIAEAITAKVSAGEHSSESEVIRNGFRALKAHDSAVDGWLHGTVGPAYDALKADPARARSVDQVRAMLVAEHAKHERAVRR